VPALGNGCKAAKSPFATWAREKPILCRTTALRESIKALLAPGKSVANISKAFFDSSAFDWM
jgi:hypothetical protein